MEDAVSTEVRALRSIRTAVVGLAFAVLTAGFAVAGGPLVFPLLVVTVAVLAGSVLLS